MATRETRGEMRAKRSECEKYRSLGVPLSEAGGFSAKGMKFTRKRGNARQAHVARAEETRGVWELGFGTIVLTVLTSSPSCLDLVIHAKIMSIPHPPRIRKEFYCGGFSHANWPREGAIGADSGIGQGPRRRKRVGHPRVMPTPLLVSK
jgi:hypothetical protein